MDDRYAQFLIVVADACLGAELGELTVEVLTTDGVRHRGVPTVNANEQPDAMNGGTLRVDESVIALAEVAEFRVCPPGQSSGSAPTLNNP